MNIESTTTTAPATKTTADNALPQTAVAKKDDSTSFKDQLNAVKTQDTKTEETTETAKVAQETQAQQNVSTDKTKTEELAKNHIVQQIASDKLTNDKLSNNKLADKNEAIKNKDVTDPITELSSKIATINELKGGVAKAKGFSFKSIESTDKIDLGKTIKMDTKDVSFFLNLVENQQMSAQAAQGSSSNQANTEFKSIQAEATQQAVQVSSTLLDAMNESAKTGKSFRIDFDSDVAVIMKVDRNGTISANFIPGDTAVENYLRNNIALLKQTFDDKGLAYNELTYSRQHKQEQQQEKRKNNKENEDE